VVFLFEEVADVEDGLGEGVGLESRGLLSRGRHCKKGFGFEESLLA